MNIGIQINVYNRDVFRSPTGVDIRIGVLYQPLKLEEIFFCVSTLISHNYISKRIGLLKFLYIVCSHDPFYCLLSLLLLTHGL